MKAFYLHVPFCNHICAYCDFMRCGYHSQLADKWLNAIAFELQEKQIKDISTVYIGGGTPSSLAPHQLSKLLDLIAPYQKNVVEYTIEANADSLSDEKIQIMKNHGVNRISLGAQTFQPSLLGLIKRNADYACIVSCIERLQAAGIENISLDLMYGLPTQTMAMWQEDLAKAVALPISHISLYSLTIEEHSQFGRSGIKPCDEDLDAQFYEYAIAYLTKHGFQHYEVSNFARCSCASKHNLAYWQYDDFYGIGCGACGKEEHVRYDNTNNLHTYITQGPTPKNVFLTTHEEMFETLMMGLRTTRGVSTQLFKERFFQDIEQVYGEVIKEQIEKGNLCLEKGYLYTTYQGRMWLHNVLVEFLKDENET